MRRTALSCILLSILACSASVAYADGMRCGTKLVSDGDSTMEVQGRCGAPDSSSQRRELRTVRNYVEGPCYKENGVVRCGTVVERTVEVIIDEWSYDFGPQSFIRQLTFEQGKLLRITTGGYGIKQT